MQEMSIHMLHKTLKQLNFKFKGEKKCQLQTLLEEEKLQLPVSI